MTDDNKISNSDAPNEDLTLHKDCTGDKVDRFRENLDIYGSHIEDWPHDQRNYFVKQIVSDSETQELFKQAKAFDKLLRLQPEPYDVTHLQAKILEKAKQKTLDSFSKQQLSRVSSRSSKKEYLNMTGLFAAALMLGVFLGLYDVFNISFFAQTQNGSEIAGFITDISENGPLEENFL